MPKRPRLGLGASWRERGMTLVLSLGMLAVLMMVMLTLAITARTERRAAAVNADMVRARMLAESAVERAVKHVETTFPTDIYPGSRFYQPPVGNAWAGGQYVSSINGADTVGIKEGLQTKIKGLNLTPAATLHDSVGWVHSTSTANVGGAQQQVILGRYAYAIIDDSGKIDPGAVVSTTVPESGTGTRTGASVTEISLGKAGIPNPDLFRPTSVEVGQAGRMPPSGKWYSLSHIVGAIHPDQATFDLIAKNLCPYSSDVERFWRDANNNNVWDEGEDEDRMDLSGTLSAAAVYNLFVGPDRGSGDDDSAWLKRQDENPWVAQWRNAIGISNVEARRRVAAHVAANIVDYADGDSVPTAVTLKADGNLENGATDAPGCYSLYGVERTWGISEVAMRIQNEIIMLPPPPGLNILGGDLNINPGNSADEFGLDTPSGHISRDTLHDQGATFTYSGAASRLYIKVKAQGRTININGQPVVLATNIWYTFVCPDMQVNLRNLNPHLGNQWQQAMGHWWIEVRHSLCSSITPDPGIPPPEPLPTNLRVTPGFKAEVFFPFGINAASSYPPGALTVSYTLRVATATGQVGDIGGTVTVPLTQTANSDGGTLAFAAAYADGEYKEIASAFDVTADPPQNWYRVLDSKIRAVTLKDQAGNIIDAVPVAAGGDYGYYLCDWVQNGQSTTSTTFHTSVKASDALMNDHGETWPDFLAYWTPRPDATNLGTTDLSGDIGTLAGTGGYDSSPYCDAAVKNGAFARIGELGRIHALQPMRSLRLWSANASETTGYDSEILDLFRIGAATPKRGKININSLQPKVLEALFKEVIPIDAAVAAQAVLAKRNAGVTFTNIGQVFGAVAGLFGSDPASDDTAEAAITKLAELITVRQNYFTVLVCAQAIKDVSGLRYDSNRDGTPDTTAAYGTFDAVTDANGNVLRYVDKVLAEHRILAVIYRDAFSNRFRVQWTERLTD